MHALLSLIRQHSRVSDPCNFRHFSAKSKCGYVNSPDLASGFPKWWDFGIWILDLNFWIQLSLNSRVLFFCSLFFIFPSFCFFLAVGCLLALWDLDL